MKGCIGKRIKDLRKKNQMTQEQLAELMAECILRNQDVSGDVEALRAGYTEMRYCFQDAEFNAALEHLADCM